MIIRYLGPWGLRLVGLSFGGTSSDELASTRLLRNYRSCCSWQSSGQEMLQRRCALR